MQIQILSHFSDFDFTWIWIIQQSDVPDLSRFFDMPINYSLTDKRLNYNLAKFAFSKLNWHSQLNFRRKLNYASQAFGKFNLAAVQQFSYGAKRSNLALSLLKI